MFIPSEIESSIAGAIADEIFIADISVQRPTASARAELISSADEER
jgi:hypothetical protein